MLTYQDALAEYQKQLREWKESLDGSRFLRQFEPENTELLELVISALEIAIEKEDMMNEWIKPADKLPARNQVVIVCRMYDADTPIVEQATYEQDNDWWKVFGTRVKTKNIIAWMPMPEPPKEVQA